MNTENLYCSRCRPCPLVKPSIKAARESVQKIIEQAKGKFNIDHTECDGGTIVFSGHYADADHTFRISIDHNGPCAQLTGQEK